MCVSRTYRLIAALLFGCMLCAPVHAGEIALFDGSKDIEDISVDLSTSPFSDPIETDLRVLNVAYLNKWLRKAIESSTAKNINLEMKGVRYRVSEAIEFHGKSKIHRVGIRLMGGGGLLEGWVTPLVDGRSATEACDAYTEPELEASLVVYRLDNQPQPFSKVINYITPLAAEYFFVMLSDGEYLIPSYWPSGWLTPGIVAGRNDGVVLSGAPSPRDQSSIAFHGSLSFEWALGTYPAKFNKTGDLLLPKEALSFGSKDTGKFKYFNTCDGLRTAKTWVVKGNLLIVSFSSPVAATEGKGNIRIASAKSAISIKNLDNVIVDNLRMIGFSGSCLDIASANKITLNNLRVNGCGVAGVSGDKIDNVRLTNSFVQNTGASSVNLSNFGDLSTLESGAVLISKNVFLRPGLILPTYAPAVRIRGVGAVVSFNEIRYTPHSAIIFSGNDNIISKNFIQDSASDVNDAGAIYAGRSWTEWGNIVRGNVISLSARTSSTAAFKVTAGVYLDDQYSGTVVEDNLIHGYPIGVLIGGGRQNTVVGNIISAAVTPIQIDNRGATWQRGLTLEGSGLLHQGLNKHDFALPPYNNYRIKTPWSSLPGWAIDNKISDNAYCDTGRVSVFEGLQNYNSYNSNQPCARSSAIRAIADRCKLLGVNDCIH